MLLGMLHDRNPEADTLLGAVVVIEGYWELD